MAVSAGNEGPSCGSIGNPPSYEPGVTTVGALMYMSTEIAPFSSRGPVNFRYSQENITKPDVVAPGSRIRGAHLNHSYIALSGTSMAAPHVAGAVLLLTSACPHLERNVTDIDSILKKTAKKLAIRKASLLCGTDNIDSVPNSVYGHGIIDIYEAISLCMSEQK